MKTIVMSFFVLVGLNSSSFAQSVVGSCALDFCYQTQGGRCVDRLGKEGLNKITAEQFKATKVGECGDFQNIIFPIDLAESNSPGPYERVNLRGANLGGAKLEQLYYKITGSLEGANLLTFHFGYTIVEGETDSNTKLPSYCVPKEKDGLPKGIFWISCLH